MDMVLWLFGDSFVHGAGLNESYAQQILDSIPRLERIEDHGWCSTALGYTYEKWESNRDKFAEDDVAIIVLTSPSRKYFFPDMPGWSYPSVIDNIPNYSASEDQRHAFNLYYAHLRRPDEERIGLVNFIHAVHDTKIKSLIIPGFPESEKILHGVSGRITGSILATGNLHTIARSEVVAGLDYPNLKEQDRRNNHICRSNLVILAQKIITAINQGNPIDLTTGFLSNIVTRERLDNPEWRMQELTDPMLPSLG